MATQREVDAGTAIMNKLIEEHVPAIFRGQISEDMVFNLVLEILEAAEKVRKSRENQP